MLDLADTDPRDTAKCHDVHAKHHANALDIARLVAQLVPQRLLAANQRTDQGTFQRPLIPAQSSRQRPQMRGSHRKQRALAA